MKAEEKAHFVRDLIGSISKTIQMRLKDMPEEWDGIELRQYIADQFCDLGVGRPMQKGRHKAYKNTVITRNL